MAKLRCMDYGFECDFEVEGEKEDVANQFRQHTIDVHGIEHSKESLIELISRKDHT